MAHDEVFGGPMAESVPTSRSSFAHRRGRADSTTSFTYYQDEEGDGDILPPSEDDSAILDDEDDIPYEEESSVDLETGEQIELRRSSSGHSRRDSVHDRLLRNDSSRTYGSNTERGHRTNHKIYVNSEDLTIVVAGFRTSSAGYALYITICVMTLGLGYLLLRWLPRWKVRIIGKSCPLRDCSWVVLEVSSPIFILLASLVIALCNQILYQVTY
jgi:cation-transporting ATPase 13A2